MTALDNSARQLEHARELMSAAGVDFPLVHASAEATAFPDASFDIVCCDHGAMTFADPYLTVPEVARLLRPGGLLGFSSHAPILELAWSLGADHPTEALACDYRGMHAIAEPGEPTAFQLPYGEWIRLFRAHGLAIEDLIEPRPGAGAQSSYRAEHDRAWALRWPMEHIWSLRRLQKSPASNAPGRSQDLYANCHDVDTALTQLLRHSHAFPPPIRRWAAWALGP